MIRRLIPTLVVAGTSLPAVAQVPPTNQEILDRLLKVENENRELRSTVDEMKGKRSDALDDDLLELGAPGSSEGTHQLVAPGRDLSETGLSQAFGGLYTKPFLASAGNIALGGYVDFEYRDPQNDDRDFRFHRLIPFIYGQPSEHVRFATEIEIEDGHHLEVEFAIVDLLMSDFFNFRAGVILTPLGKFNLVHDSPINELTDRPLVSTFVIPTSMREPGVGGFGTLANADSSVGQITYEAYFTSGFKGLLDDGTAAFNTDEGLREGRSHEPFGPTDPFEDINNGFAGVGRLEWSPTLGGVVGISGHHGAYDESGENDMTILAIDGALDGRVLSRLLGASGGVANFINGFEFLGEAAHASLQTDALAEASGIPDRLGGWYGQVNYRIYPDFLASAVQGGWFDRGAHFTLVARYDDVDLDGFERERVTFGVNFRPNQSQTVIKFDYQLNTESGKTPSENDDAFVASIATYF